MYGIYPRITIHKFSNSMNALLHIFRLDKTHFVNILLKKNQINYQFILDDSIHTPLTSPLRGNIYLRT